MRRPPTGPGLVVTGTGTGVGKTVVSRGLAAALTARGFRVAGLKPFETGVGPNPEDAVALARACKRPELAHAPGLYRTAAPLAPFAAELRGAPACDPGAVAETVRSLAVGSDIVLLEGAGGIAVPLTATETFADFAALLGWPIVLVARNELGVISHVLTALDYARGRGLEVAIVALGNGSTPDASAASNREVITRLVETPVVNFDALDPDPANGVAPILAELALPEPPRRD